MAHHQNLFEKLNQTGFSQGEISFKPVFVCFPEIHLDRFEADLARAYWLGGCSSCKNLGYRVDISQEEGRNGHFIRVRIEKPGELGESCELTYQVIDYSKQMMRGPSVPRIIVWKPNVTRP